MKCLQLNSIELDSHSDPIRQTAATLVVQLESEAPFLEIVMELYATAFGADEYYEVLGVSRKDHLLDLIGDIITVCEQEGIEIL